MSSTVNGKITGPSPGDRPSQPAVAKKPLPLPEPPHDVDGVNKTLDVSGGGTTVKLDHLGPLVVNQDGTMSRIANWAEMAEIEKKNTLRILGKRNQLRLEALRRKDGVNDEDKPSK